MKTRFPFPLRFSVPLMLFLVGSLLSVLSIFYETRVFNRALEVLLEGHANFQGNQVSGLATYFFSQNDLAGLKKHVSQLGSDRALKTALVCDASEKVVVSTRFDYLKQGLGLTHLNGTTNSIRSLRAAQVSYSADRNTMVGLFPFHLPPAEGELVSTRQGVVLLEYDLSRPKQQAFNAAIDRSKAVIVSLGIICFLTWFCFHHFLNRRIQRLVVATRRLAAGETTAFSVDISGSDEVAVLARAFEEMGQKLSIHNQELRAANDRMKREMEERILVQAALANSERRFRSIWENCRDPLRLSDGKGNVLAVNQAYCDLVGMRSEDLLQRPFVTPYAMDGGPMLAKYQKQFAERSFAVQQQKLVTYKDGRTAHLEIAYSFVDLGSDQIFLLGIFRDVSARVAALKELQKAKDFTENLIRTANVLIIALDGEGKIQIFNQTAESILGWSKEEALGQAWLEKFIPEEEQGRMRQVFQDVKKGGFRTYENHVLTRGGSLRTISWQNNEIVENGEVIGTLSFGIDITEQREQEARRRDLESKLQETQKLESLGILAGGIAHDFNNLLTAILGNASLAGMQLPANSPVRPMLTTIEKTSLRAADLCKQMLAYSGKGKLTAEHSDLNELIKDTTQLLEISISKKASLLFNLQPNLPAIECDPTQIRQVLMNLVINASEALDEKQGGILIRTGVLSADAKYFAKTHLAPELPAGEYVYFEVVDSGSGMSPETQAKIFDPFFTTKFTGRGLGLAAVLGIVRGHRGALKLTSEPGKGSTFRVLLPAMDKPACINGASGAQKNEWKGKGTILVVDDDQQVREVTGHILQSLGFDVLQAVDGADGLRVFRQNESRIEAVLLDMTMPRLNGNEVFREIRRHSPRTKVLMMSGYNEPEKQTLLANDVGTAFLQKPFKPEDVAQKLQSVLGI